MTARLLIIMATLFAAGAILRLWTSRRQGRHRTGDRFWVKYGIYAVVVTIMVGAIISGPYSLIMVVTAIGLAGACEIRRAEELHTQGRSRTGLLLVSLVSIGMAHLWLCLGLVGTGFALFVFVVVAATDSFAQLVGSLFGRHTLCRSISPNKTKEGLAGGLVTAVVVGCTCGFLVPGCAVGAAAGLAIVTACGAVAGDLIFSAAKRRWGIKDFSTAIPEHGGVLDRFDSLVVAAPSAFWASQLLDYMKG